MSHFAFLGIRDPDHSLRNTVFPFLTNWMMYLIAGVIEFIVAIVCFGLRARDPASVVILAFVGTMVWYRWAFNYTGGNYCGCLGLLGRLLHLSKEEESVIPPTTLAFLGLTTGPWLMTGFRRLLQRLTSRPAVIVLLILVHGPVCAQRTIEVRGIVDVAGFNPRTASPYPVWARHSSFTALISGNAWNVRVTDIEHPGWWEERSCDGTDSYSLQPYGEGFLPKGTNHPRADLALAVVTRSPVPIPPEGGDALGSASVCITYGWSPEVFRTNALGLVEIPIPWTVVRENPRAWGYRWDVHGWGDGRFLDSFDVVRDKGLDWEVRREFFRPELDYPETLAQYNGYMRELDYRKSEPDGRVRARYRVTEWYRTNGVTLPAASRLEVFLPPPNDVHPARVFEVRATLFTVLATNVGMAPEILTNTVVADYRYKRSNNTRIFRYAEYSLRAGDGWKTATDPALLAQAQDWLKHGRKFTHFADTRKHWIAWLLLAALVAVPVALMRFKARQRQTLKI